MNYYLPEISFTRVLGFGQWGYYDLWDNTMCEVDRPLNLDVRCLPGSQLVIDSMT